METDAMSMNEKVNHPDHYNISGRKECIVEMEERFGVDAVITFCELNAYKYRYRSELKGGQDDLDKAQWYEDYMRRLDQETCEPCDDAISRKDAIRIASGYCHFSNVAKELAKLPSVNKEAKDGRNN